MENVVIEHDPQAVWDELAAEHAGQPANPAKVDPTPDTVQAAVQPDEVKPDALAQMQAQIAELEKLSTRMRNAEGHIGSLNGTQKELKALLDASKLASQHASQAPTQSEVREAAGNPAEWDALKADYPEWGGAIEKLLDVRINNQGSGFDAKAFEASVMEKMRGENDAMRKEIVESALDAVFPTWKDDLNSTSFTKWQNEQPDNIKALLHSEKVSDAAKMLKLFEAAKLADPAAQVIAQRQKNLAAATATPKGARSTATPQKSWEDMSTAERWDHEKRLAAKRRN